MNDLIGGAAMRKFIALLTVAIFSLSFSLAQGATKPLTQVPMTLVTSLSPSDQSVGMVVKGKTIYLIGTVTGVVSTDGFVQALDSTGTVQWSLPLDNGLNEIATAATFDSAGNLWVVGSAQTPSPSPSPSPTPPVTPTPTVLNPDAVTADPTAPIRKDLTSLALWKISSAGVLLASFTAEVGAPFLVRSTIFANNAINVVGIISTTVGHAGFLMQSDLNGTIGKPVLVGKADTELNALAKKSDGSLVLLGSSSETIAKQSRKGTRDGIIVSMSQEAKISSVVRSSNLGSARGWQSATNSFFLGGDAMGTGKSEAVVTKFSSTLVPTWTMRFASASPALTADSSTSHFMVFSSTGLIAGIKGWNPKKTSTLTLGIDSKGLLNGAYGAPAIATPMAIGYSRELGVVVLGRGPTGVSIFHALPR